jgi:hypothetical protein
MKPADRRARREKKNGNGKARKARRRLDEVRRIPRKVKGSFLISPRTRGL